MRLGTIKEFYFHTTPPSNKKEEKKYGRGLFHRSGGGGERENRVSFRNDNRLHILEKKNNSVGRKKNRQAFKTFEM